MFRKLAVFGLIATLTACSIAPQPMSVPERYKLAEKSLASLSKEQSCHTLKIDYYEALARSVKYNLDYRLKIVNSALQAGQLDVAVFTMFPALNASGTVYSRNNDYAVAGISASGFQTGLSSSTPRTLRTSRVAMSWNILDFGMGYVKAKQQSDRVLIAQEESRRQLQQLGQDVLVAYWVAYSSQQLMDQTKEFQKALLHSKQILEKAMYDKAVPKESILNYQAALLEGERKLIQLQYKYDKAMLELKHLLFLPSDQHVVLAPPPRGLFSPQDLTGLDLAKMDVVTLVNHPQLQGQHYQERLARFGLATVLLQALPGLTLNYGWNYDSNQYLQNNKWLDKSLDVAWNLLNLASLPASYKTAKMQVQYENVKVMAMTMAALTESRYAFAHYRTLNREYQLAHLQALNAQLIYNLNQARRKASIASDQQVIMAKLRAITSKMDEDLLLSDLSVALGELYLSIGVNTVPEDIMYKPLNQATAVLRNQLYAQGSFTSFVDNQYYSLFRDLPVLPNNQTKYTVQLCASTDLNAIKETQKKLSSNIPLSIAKSKRDGKEFYVLAYGKFNSQKNATFYASHLPQEKDKFAPFVRPVDQLTWLS